MADKKYNVVIVGFGGMGGHHSRMIPALERANLAGTFDIDDKRQKFAKKKGIKPYDSFEAVLADDSVDIVLIATPNDAHKGIAIKAMRAGKHVICEKPVACNSAELAEILEVQKETGKIFMVHQNRRWDKDYLMMKKIYDDGLIGDVFRVESKVHGSRGIPGDWRGRKEQGGGMMLDWGVHLIDRMLQMIHEKVSRVYCTFTNITNKEVDDGFVMSLEFESGKTALIEVGTRNFIESALWYMTGVDGSAIIRDWSNKGKIVRLQNAATEDATPIVAGVGLTKTMAPRDEYTTSELPLPDVDGDINDFYNNFFDQIEGIAEAVIKNTEVMRVMKLMEAAFESGKKKQAIEFE